MDKLKEIINTILINKGEKSIDQLRKDTHLRDNIGLDSLDLAELTVRIEAEFGIDIFKDGIVTTISEILKKIEK